MSRLVPFAATNEPDTCLWCGRKLLNHTKQEVRLVPFDSEEGQALQAKFDAIATKLQTYIQDVGSYADSKYLEIKRERDTWNGWNVWKRDMYHAFQLSRFVPDPDRKPGWLDSGYFCSLGCGFQFGLVLAQNGKTLVSK